MDGKRIYKINEWKGYGKSYYWNEYYQDGDTVNKYKCSRSKFFDGRENSWSNSEPRKIDEWKIGDGDMPDWINQYTK